MNMKAAELKMTGSHFVNPHGLNQKVIIHSC
jgi:D-alanyl-D-alanine carboxypeptidase